MYSRKVDEDAPTSEVGKVLDDVQELTY